MKFIVLLLPYLESQAVAMAFLTSKAISAAHLSPIEAFVPMERERERENKSEKISVRKVVKKSGEKSLFYFFYFYNFDDKDDCRVYSL